MQKNNSTVKKQPKNVSRNALQIIIQDLSLSDSKKVKMYEDLRCMGITDDNDPLIKFTMLQGLLAQYNGNTAEKVVRERENIEEAVEEIENTVETIKDTVEEIKELYKHFYNAILELRKRDLAELKDSIKLWKNEAIIGAQEMIVELRYEGGCLNDKIKKQQEELHKVKEEIYKANKKHDEIVNRGFTVYVVIALIGFVIFLVFLGLIYINGYEKLLEEITIRRKLIKKYNVTPKLVKCNGKMYVLVRRNDIVNFNNGTTGAELDTWSVMDDIW